MLRKMAMTLGMMALTATASEGRELRVATWNLGWHMSKAMSADWVQKCSAPFQWNEKTGLWEPGTAGPSGWELKWGRDAKIAWDISVLPPCDVFQAFHDVVPVTATAYDKRDRQISSALDKAVQPDVIAFQEVSGKDAVLEVLPGGPAAWNVCSFTDYKVQRMAIAWKKELGEGSDCSPFDGLSLPNRPEKERPRPGLAVTIKINGEDWRFLTVHLKSSCVSPLEATAANPDRGKLDGGDTSCEILRDQVPALESWLESETGRFGHLVLLGDFNRNLWHEKSMTGNVRSDGSDPTTVLPSGVLVRNLLKEVDDVAPTSSEVSLLEETCPLNDATKKACADAEIENTAEAVKVLSKPENLGCRNPVGLDHILISSGLKSDGHGQKVPLGKMGRTLKASAEHPDPLLALSDHCPLVATLSAN